MSPPPKIHVVGLGADGLDGLTRRARETVEAADLVLGNDRALALIPPGRAERFRIDSDLSKVLDRLRLGMGREKMVVLSQGDPLFYGVARYLCDKLGRDGFEVLPHVSSMQLAFARVKESWEEAFLTDLASRTIDDALDRIRAADTVGLFTTEEYSPGRVARELLLRGADDFRAFVCENLGGRDERITQGDLGEIAAMTFDPLNVMILRRKPGRPVKSKASKRLMRFGNPDDAFAQSRPKTGLITQSEVRALALAQLDLQPGTVMWDVGAGSGSVALEAAQLVGTGTVYAIEQDPADYHLIVANAETYGVANVRAVFGSAPAVFKDLPAPDAAFVGGNGGEVARLVEATFGVLKPGGRIASHVATLEMLSAVHGVLRRLAGSVSSWLVNLSRGIEQIEALRFEATNPSFLLVARKPAPEERHAEGEDIRPAAPGADAT